MDRREFLAIGALGLVGSAIPKALRGSDRNTPVYCGWNPSRRLVADHIRRTARPYLSQQTSSRFKGSGKGKIVLLHKYLARALGTIIPHNQDAPDCVGQAFGLGVDTLASTQIYGLGLREKFEAKAVTEAIYAGSRYEIGFKVHGNAKILRSGGSHGSYAAEFLRDYGVLVRKRYGDIDLTKYDSRISYDWGRNGIPDHLEAIARRHPVRSFALVRSYADCRDAICNGYPVVFCSDYGFNPDCRRHNPGGRDAEGFLNRCGTWYHAMLGLAVDDTKRPGILLCNSWGPHWVFGGTRHMQPLGSFWVDAATIDGMCGQGDSYALSSYVGFRSQNLDYKLF